MKSSARWCLLLAAVALTAAWGGSAQASGILYASLTNGVIERYDLTTGQDLGTFASGLNNPQGMAFDSAGNLFVANGGGGTISKIIPDGTVSTFATGFQVPTGLAFDSAGNLYVANYGGDVIRSTSISKITSDGTVSTFASVSMNGYYGPNGLAFDSSGNLYTSVSRFDNALKVAPDGTVSIFVPGPNTGKLNWPTGLAFDKSGNLYAANSVFDPFISKIAPDGSVSNFYQGHGRGGNWQSGMVYDQSSGDLFVANFSSSLSIDMLTADGSLSTFASGLQATPQFLVIGPQLSSVPEPAALIPASTAFVLVALVAWFRRRKAKS